MGCRLGLCAFDGGGDGGLGDGAEGLGVVVLIALELDTPDAVGVGFDTQGGDGGVCTEGTAGETFAGGCVVAEDLAAGEEREHRTSNKEHRTPKAERDGPVLNMS